MQASNSFFSITLFPLFIVLVVVLTRSIAKVSCFSLAVTGRINTSIDSTNNRSLTRNYNNNKLLSGRTTINRSLTSNSLNMKSVFSEESPSIQSLVKDAMAQYNVSFKCNSDDDEASIICSVAPGRVNLIGEHTDYTGGFVFPMAIEFSTVCYGSGSINTNSPIGKCEIISVNHNSPKIISFDSHLDMKPLPAHHPDFWANYIIGVVAQYIQDIPNNHTSSISFRIAINGNVPLGSGLSSSAALEVAIATFLESILEQHSDSVNNIPPPNVKTKALRCQKAENEFCNSPCGIMDQFVSAAASTGSALLIDCRTLDFESIQFASAKEEEKKESGDEEEKEENPVFVICNSNVKHSIGGGEYPIRVAQCKTAACDLQRIYGDRIQLLRDATTADVEGAKSQFTDDVIYRRAKHVTAENERTQLAKNALIQGRWNEVGILMNASHESMKIDYEVSCEEIDILVELAQKYNGVYGSRLTGGGFGGCTVSLVKKKCAEEFCEYLQREYKEKTGKDCFTFQTSPGAGARQIIL